MSNQPNDDGRDGLPSASGMERLANCPGSRAAELACGPMPDTEIADQGSRIHKALETGDIKGLDSEETDIVESIQKIEGEAVGKWRHDLAIPKDAVIQPVMEERLWVRRTGTLEPLASAKMDKYWRWQQFALVIDFKSGFLPTTPSPYNWQLRTAALALRSEIPNLGFVRVAIAQHRFRSRYDACEYSQKDLAEAENDLLHIIWKSEQPDAERMPGPWCKYCSAKANCPQYAAMSLMPLVKLNPDYDPTLRGKSLATEITCRVSLLSPADLAFIYEKRHIMAGIQEAVKVRLGQMLLDDLHAIGLDRSENSPVREVSDIDGAFNIFMREGLMSVDEFHTCCKLVMGNVEEIVKRRIVEKGKAKNQKEALDYLRKILSPVFTLRTRQPSIVKLETAPAVPVPTPHPETPELIKETDGKRTVGKEEVVVQIGEKHKPARTTTGKVRGKNPRKVRAARQGDSGSCEGKQPAPPQAG